MKVAVGAVVAASLFSIVCCGPRPTTPAPVFGASSYLSDGRLAVGLRHVCVLGSKGYAECWGNNNFGQLNLKSTERFVLLDAGDFVTCGLTGSGVIECTGPIDGTRFPEGYYKRFWLGGSTGCGLRMDGSVVCVGENGGVAERVLQGLEVRNVSFGRQHGCAITSTELLCWTANGTVEQINRAFRAVRVDDLRQKACAFDGTDSYCWKIGRWANRVRETGDVFPAMSRTCRVQPGKILSCSPAFGFGPNPQMSEFGIGSGFVCFTGKTQRVICRGKLVGWGLEHTAREWVQASGPCLRAKSGEVRCFGHARTPGARFDSFAASFAGGCGENNGKFSCWGRFETPEGTFKEPAVGDQVACAMDRSGHLRCWGRDPPVTESDEMPSIKQLSLGDEYVCALSHSGTTRCWGDGPTQPDAGLLHSITVGSDLACGLDEVGEAHCWHSSGKALLPKGRFRSLSVSESGSSWCGVRHDGGLTCSFEPVFLDDSSTSLYDYRQLMSRVDHDMPDGLSDVSLTKASLCWIAVSGAGGCVYASGHGWVDTRPRSLSPERSQNAGQVTEN